MEYKTITRAAVDVDPTAARYFTEDEHLLAGCGDKMLDLILNGPTINGIRKGVVRGMLRDTYAALKRYEMIGPMASPLLNDPVAIVALAFRELHPGTQYAAQLVPNLRDEDGAAVYGETVFPDGGGNPIVSISAEAPLSAAPELLAHELAHIAAGIDAGHGPEWEAAEQAILDKYNELLDGMISGERETIITPHKVGDGGILALPLVENVPDPGRDDWRRVTCPICGAECWESDGHRQAMAAEPELRAACTACALRGGRA